jgi:cell division transport system permease protein
MGLAAFRRRIRSWSRRHSFSFFSSLGALLKHRIGTLMTVLVLGIAILLPLGLYIFLKNLDRLDLRQEEWGAVTVFMSADAGEDRLRQAAEELDRRADVAAVELVSPEQGMAEFKASSGFGQSLEMLEENPLPWVMMVSPVVGGNGGPV